MHDARSGESASQQSSDHPAEAVLGLLLARHPALVALAELVSELVQGPARHGLSEFAVHDGVADLVGDGLAHRVDERFVVASYAAVRAARLIG